MLPQHEPDKLNVQEYVNMFPAGRRNEVRRQIDLFVKKYGKYPVVTYHSLQLQLEESVVNETTGICNDCIKGYHDSCRQVLGSDGTGPVFCTCYCTGDTSFGNILYKEPIPHKVKEEFKDLPEL